MDKQGLIYSLIEKLSDLNFIFNLENIALYKFTYIIYIAFPLSLILINFLLFINYPKYRLFLISIPFYPEGLNYLNSTKVDFKTKLTNILSYILLFAITIAIFLLPFIFSNFYIFTYSSIYVVIFKSFNIYILGHLFFIACKICMNFLSTRPK